ncbi:hypothetical protein Anapl_00766 [Anas platyrhynchos]|uniref:Uncharacterized protein n=1 Tax=Anas platyrhynchos TaxID=8839 RepID=R0JSR8_ANAPL|nr:hypothetical protein Anapl_00766 [Anas platyrhynchos]
MRLAVVRSYPPNVHRRKLSKTYSKTKTKNVTIAPKLYCHSYATVIKHNNAQEVTLVCVISDSSTMGAEAADALKHSPQLWALLMKLIQALKFLTQAGRRYSVTVQRYHLPFIHKGYVLPTHTRSLKSYTVIKELANL